jgi:hypothetical protein
MSAGLLALVAFAYVGVAIGYAVDGRWGMAVSFIAYAAANLGFILDLRPW